MLVGFLAEPALLMVFFTASLISQSTSLADHRRDAGAPRVRDLSQHGVRRGRLCHGAAGRERAHPGGQPGHPPRTHHDPRGDDPRILGAPPGADRVGEQRSSCSAYTTIGIALFVPWGIAEAGDWAALPLALAALPNWPAGRRSALLETFPPRCAFSARPEFLGTAFLLAVLGMLIHFLLGA